VVDIVEGSPRSQERTWKIFFRLSTIPWSSMPDDELRCPECGAKVRVFQRFCGSCGESMTWEVGEGQEPPKCPQCNEPVEVYQEKCDKCGMVMNWDPADTGQMASTPVDQEPPRSEPQQDTQSQQATVESRQIVEEKPREPGGGSTAKRAGATILVVIIAVVVLAWAFPYLVPSTPTVRVAVYNDCETDTLDVKVYVDDVLQKHMAIYNGYWADFGTYSVPDGGKVSVEATPETSLTKSRDYTISEDTDVAVIVNNYYAETSDYPDSTITPLSAPFDHRPPTTIMPTLMLQVDYERSDWDTTNVGEVDHLVYVLSLEPWVDGRLRLVLLDRFGQTVYSVGREFTSLDVDVDSVTFAYEIYMPGDPLDAEAYFATYELVGGGTISDSGYITGPY
jgi:hypothetical protein